jgi:hypothetical protein
VYVTPSPYIVNILGVRAVDACCALGGGHPCTNLMIDPISPLKCMAGWGNTSTFVVCGCSDPLQRYDAQTFTCISSCDAGMMWSDSEGVNRYKSIVSQQGTCVDCPAGRTSATGSWECQDLPSGQYGGKTILCLLFLL